MQDRVGIIIIDDNELDLMISERLIQRVNSSLEVITFSSGEDAIKWMDSEESKTFAKNLIFLIDVYMPKINGYEMVSELSERIPDQIVATFYLLSATIDDGFQKKVERNPVISGFIGKPLSVPAIQDLTH